MLSIKPPSHLRWLQNSVTRLSCVQTAERIEVLFEVETVGDCHVCERLGISGLMEVRRSGQQISVSDMVSAD